MPSNTDRPDFNIVIPARYASTRFPGKALQPLLGKPMLGHVYDRALAAGAEEIVVAVDEARLADYCEGAGLAYVMTSPDHANGTERIVEVAALKNWSPDTLIVGLQCDEPATPPAIIIELARNLAANPDADLATLCTRIETIKDYLDPNRVKVVRDQRDYALYFSRSPIPARRDTDQGKGENEFPESWLHVGMYAYRCGFLSRYTQFTETAAEHEEKLEQLRPLGFGCKIHVGATAALASHGVDRPEDLPKAEAALRLLLMT